LAEVMRGLASLADVVIMAAAVADFRVAEVSEGKLTKEAGGVPSLTLVENEDIVAGLAANRREGQRIVAFAAETGEDYLERGKRKRRKKDVDFLAVNQVGWTKGFETSHNTLYFLDVNDDVVGEASGSKREVADALLDLLV
ncbi:MAG: phosphopantothenoylcysteine decarboxylase, partial [Propionibacteriaceae bacterium]|nr:phosphopantothenoylcysteine decarboxylase [Propionibacteriaceae bacterium]